MFQNCLTNQILNSHLNKNINQVYLKSNHFEIQINNKLCPRYENNKEVNLTETRNILKQFEGQP